MIIKTNIDKVTIRNKEIYVKREDTQVNKSFKIRGSLNFIKKNFKNTHTKLITASSGNLGIQVSFIANEMKIPLKVYLPMATPNAKKEKIKSFNAEILLRGDTVDESIKIANTNITAEELFVPPYDSKDIIEGNKSVWEEDRDFYLDKEIDLFVPVGGGSIAASACEYFSSFKNIRIITVETNKTNSLQKSIENGKITTIEIKDTIAEGLSSRTPGKITFPIIKKYAYESISIDENYLLEIMDELIDKKIYLETAGATAFAGAVKYDSGNRTQVALFSGGDQKKA